MLRIITPTYFPQETQYILETIFKEFLGISYSFSTHQENFFVLSFDNIAGKIIIRGMFNNIDPWHDSPAPLYMALVPAKNTENHSMIPLCGIDIGKPLLEMEEKEIFINFDLFGSTFYFLSRMEEYVSTERDFHGRFPAKASHAYKNNYLHRPVVNEYVEILWQCMKKLWPGLEREQRSFSMKLTHDVDAPFENLFRHFRSYIRLLGKDFTQKNRLQCICDRFFRWIDVKRGYLERDPFYTFNLIMDIGESVGSKDAFYFIPSNDAFFDGNYELGHPKIKALMASIAKRGHEIGFHGSYKTFRDLRRTQQEVLLLKDVCASLGIEQPIWGGRQHYLRWEIPKTWRNYAEAGLDYDTTLSYADCAGFRCGTCYPFQVYDLEKRKPLDLWEHPLTIMECSLFDKQYMNLSYTEAFSYAKELKNTCRKYKGEFVVLWHNSHFVLPEEIEFYKELVMG